MHNPPSYRQLASELPRSGLETLRLVFSLRSLLANSAQGDGRPVLAIPGYGGGDSSMLFMRYFLDKLGYQSYALDLGVNYESASERIKRVEDAVAFREKMVARVAERAEQIYKDSGETVTLLGWSMGGLYAFDVSQQHPDIIRQVITLGAPFGDPRGTSTFKLLRWVNRSTVAVEEQDFDSWTHKRQLSSDKVPVKIIYSTEDGIVAAHIARLDDHPMVEHIEVTSSHVGFTVNTDTLAIIAGLLAQPSP
jgi:esterase/lipase